MPQTYASKKARMDRDPAYRTKVYRQQSQSRRNRKARLGIEPPCQFPDGRPCWRTSKHSHPQP